MKEIGNKKRVKLIKKKIEKIFEKLIRKNGRDKK